jgi:hypothetical protein
MDTRPQVTQMTGARAQDVSFPFRTVFSFNSFIFATHHKLKHDTYRNKYTISKHKECIPWVT